MVFTAMVAAKAVRFNLHASGKLPVEKEPVIISYESAEAAQEATQVASRRDKLKLVCQIKID